MLATLLFHQAFITFFQLLWLSQLTQRPLTAIVLIVIRCREMHTLKYVRKRSSLHYYDSMQNLLIIEPLRAIHKTLNIFLLKIEIITRAIHQRKSSMVVQFNILICLMLMLYGSSICVYFIYFKNLNEMLFSFFNLHSTANVQFFNLKSFPHVV